MIKFLIEKEFKQLLRNSFLPKLILIFPCMIMLLHRTRRYFLGACQGDVQ